MPRGEIRLVPRVDLGAGRSTDPADKPGSEASTGQAIGAPDDAWFVRIGDNG